MLLPSPRQRLGSSFHRQAVGGDILGRRTEIEQQQQGEKREQVTAEDLPRVELTEGDQQQDDQQLHRQNPAAVGTGGSKMVTVDQGCPDEFQHPGQGEQFEESDVFEGNLVFPQQGGQRVGQQPGGQPLGKVQAGEQDKYET